MFSYNIQAFAETVSITFTEADIPKLETAISQSGITNGYYFNIPYLELQTPLGVVAYSIKLQTPLDFSSFSIVPGSIYPISVKDRIYEPTPKPAAPPPVATHRL